MRLAVLSDIHGNQIALEAVLEDLKKVGKVDATWILGDLCTLGPRPLECLQIIRQMPNTQVIRGNTDDYLVTGSLPSQHGIKDEAAWNNFTSKYRKHVAWHWWAMEQLSWADAEYLLNLHGGLDLHVKGYGYVVGYHGSPGNNEYMMLPDTPDEEVLDQFLDTEGRLGFGGHTHLPMVRDLDMWRVVNVGSVGLPKDETRACYVLADITSEAAILEFRRVAYDRDAVIADARQRNFPESDWLVARLNGDWS
jgi:predicted phosphodiesterase